MSVFEGGGGVVDGAGTTDDEETIIGEVEDVDGGFAALDDGGFSVGGEGKF